MTVGCGGVDGKWVVAWARGGVMSMCVVSLDYLCRWQVRVSVYCARWIPVHLRCTQCSMLYLQMSKIQTCLRIVVEPGLIVK